MKLFNWKVDEPEIHSYIIQAYEKQGYECINFHDSGPSVENGVDIFSNRYKETIGVAVKISPKQKDVEQLKKFVKNKIKRKIYVYINDPTRPFFEELKKLKDKGLIEVMNAKTLHKFLIENRSVDYVKKYIFSHKLFASFIAIMKNWESVREAKILKPTREDIKLLWDWKDKAVSFHKVSRAIFDCMDPKIKNVVSEEEVAYKSIIYEILPFLDYINREAEQLKSIFESVKITNPGLLSYMWSICRSRSNWCDLLAGLERKDESVNDVFFNWFFEDIGSGDYTLFAEILENIKEFGSLIEMAVDWVFSDIKK